MTFNPDAKIDSGKVSHRGRNTGLAVGGGGIGVIAVFLIAQLFGVDLSGLTGAGTGGGQASDEPVTGCETGADANENIDCRMAGAASSLDVYWADQFQTEGIQYATPGFFLFEDATNTGCGGATSAVGPFYCPPDQAIYLDTGFFDELRGRFGASGGPLAEMYVVAHEWGHHVQNLVGTMDQLNRQDTGPQSDAVRLELQADCYAGAWAGAASTVPDETGTPFLQPITKQQIADALNAAAAIGDDRIQEQTTGQVNPEGWTHGSSEQRQTWFERGFESGLGSCNTFEGSI